MEGEILIWKGTFGTDLWREIIEILSWSLISEDLTSWRSHQKWEICIFERLSEAIGSEVICEGGQNQFATICNRKKARKNGGEKGIGANACEAWLWYGNMAALLMTVISEESQLFFCCRCNRMLRALMQKASQNSTAVVSSRTKSTATTNTTTTPPTIMIGCYAHWCREPVSQWRQINFFPISGFLQFFSFPISQIGILAL